MSTSGVAMTARRCRSCGRRWWTRSSVPSTPAEVILFGSVARGEDGPDSDIDLLVVFDHVDPADKRSMMARIRSAINTFAPVDVIVSDPVEMARRRDDVGSILYWPAREGRSVYRRASAEAV